MTDHLTQLEVYEIAADGTADPSATAHSSTCATCAGKIATMRQVLDAVERIEPAIEPPADVERRLAQRIDGLSPRWRVPGYRPSRSSRWLSGAAAAVVCFAAGVATHAALVPAREGPPAAAEGPVAETPPALDVQRAGTDYVAAIALMVADSSRLSSEDLRTGREVALAAMSGAASELRLLHGGESSVEELHRVVERARLDAAAGTDP